MNFKIDAKRVKTLKQRLGESVKLIDDERYLPLFRNRQINYEEEFNFSVELAKTKKNASRYLAKIWSKSNLNKTLRLLRKLINLAKNKAAAAKSRAKELARANQPINAANLERLNEMKKQFNLIS